MNNNDTQKELKEDVKKLSGILDKLAIYLDKINLQDYILLIQNPLRLMYLNFLSGMARGLGIALGMTLLFGLLIIILTKLINVPLIGTYIAEIIRIVNQELKK